MASLHCAHCTRRIFLRPQQLPPLSGLCVPCGHKAAERHSLDRAWRRFRQGLLQPADAPPRPAPLLPAADLRHL
jgi:hypothetical protein